MELQQQAQQPKTALSSELPNIALPSLALPRCPRKIYHGVRHRDGTCEVFVDELSASTPLRPATTSSRPLPLHLELRNHSPTGFAWGYGGSGPAQLALAILVDATGEQGLAVRHHKEFKFRFVSRWGESWRISQDQINSFLAAQEYPASCRPA